MGEGWEDRGAREVKLTERDSMYIVRERMGPTLNASLFLSFLCSHLKTPYEEIIQDFCLLHTIATATSAMLMINMSHQISSKDTIPYSLSMNYL